MNDLLEEGEALTPEERDDLDGITRQPQHVAEFLLSIGGDNPHGEPMYRCVKAELRVTIEGGEWTDWRPGTTLAERGGLVSRTNEAGQVVQMLSPEKPLRVVSEYRRVRRYPDFEGWCLERWFHPPSRAEWEFHKMKDGRPRLGPYPDHGEYLIIAGPCGEVPNLEELQAIVEEYEYSIHTRRGTPAQRIRQRLLDRANHEAQQVLKESETNLAVLKEMLWFMTSSSLEAGRTREAMAKTLRARGSDIGHVGN